MTAQKAREAARDAERKALGYDTDEEDYDPDLAYEQAMMSPEAFWGGVAGFGRAFGCDGAWD